MEKTPAHGVGDRVPVRVRNELVFREITVKESETVAGCFQRIVFTGEQLRGFTSAGFDDHIKVFFPPAAGVAITLPRITEDGVRWDEGPRPPSRDYTPLYFNQEHNELTLDFYLHEGGIASGWAAGAKPGDSLMMGGPRGSLVVPADFGWQLYIADETGMPAIKRRLAELNAAGTRANATVWVNVKDARCLEYFADEQDTGVDWIVAGHPADAGEKQTLTEKIRRLAPPQEDYFIWATGEGRLVKEINDHLIGRQKLDPVFVRTVAYWHEK